MSIIILLFVKCEGNFNCYKCCIIYIIRKYTFLTILIFVIVALKLQAERKKEIVIICSKFLLPMNDILSKRSKSIK